jgi:hypothetical protein
MTTQDTPNQAQTPAAAAAAAADRTWWDRIEPRVLNVMLVVIVASSMVVTGYQSWRMQPQLGASSWWDGALSVSLLTLLPPYVAYYTAKYWQGRGTDWLGVLLFVALESAFFLGTVGYLQAHHMSGPYSAAAILTGILALGPISLALHVRERARRAS